MRTISIGSLGIVRNIDPVNKLFYILTPVPLDKLKRVNLLQKGSLEIPACLLIQVGNIFSVSCVLIFEYKEIKIFTLYNSKM